MADRKRIYYTDAQKAGMRNRWPRRRNKNTDGLLRQYFPKKGTDLRVHSHARLNTVAR